MHEPNNHHDDRGHFGLVVEAIHEVLDAGAPELVSAYYAKMPRRYGDLRNVLFAGRHFDEIPGNEPNAFTPADLAAASLLDVRFGPHAVIELLDSEQCNAMLARVPVDLPIWEAGSTDLDENSPAGQLWARLTQIPNIGATRASKLLARKRPHLFPILDSVIVRALHLQDVNAWTTLREVLRSEVRTRIDQLGHAAKRHGALPPSTLRLLDVATWMAHSQSRQAKAVRASLLP